MKIAVDIDDVLADSMPVFIDFYRKYYDTDFTYSDMLNYDYLGFLGETKEEAEKKIYHFNKSEFFHQTKPFKDAQRAIKLLATSHEIIALTSRPIYIQEGTKKWVKKYFPEIKEVLFNNSNSSSAGTLTKQKSKAEVCLKNGVDILIEDLVKFVRDSHEDLRVLLIDRPWNQGELPENVIRVKNWDEILGIIGT